MIPPHQECRRQVYLDTETTGLSPLAGHRITEIACAEVVDGVATGRVYQTYLNPERELDPKAAEITGLSWSRLRAEPKFVDVAKDFLAFIGDDELVIHNAAFDVRFLNSELARCGLSPLTNPVCDTLCLAKARRPVGQRGLDALCDYYDIPSRRMGGIHGAMVDVKMLIDVHKCLLSC